MVTEKGRRREKRREPAKHEAKRPRPAGLAVPTSTRTSERQASAGGLLGPHVAAITKLEARYNVLAASIISSSQIRRRVSYLVNHLLSSKLGEKEPLATLVPKTTLVLLHARPADVCKLITVVEQCKRVLKEEGAAFYQYNQLFQPPARTQKPDVVDETVLQGHNEQDSLEDDGFEPLETRLDKALSPPQRMHAPRSIRIFLSCTPVPELKTEPSTTLQTSETETVAAAPA